MQFGNTSHPKLVDCFILNLKMRPAKLIELMPRPCAVVVHDGSYKDVSQNSARCHGLSRLTLGAFWLTE